MTGFFRLLMALCVITLFCTQIPPAFGAKSPDAEKMGIDENDLTQKARENRLSQDQLIALGENISYFTKLKLYLYAKELEPFFLGLEDSVRDLARVDPQDKAALLKAKHKVSRIMRLCRARLAQDKQRNLETDWKRGLTGLIFLDHNWRKRVYDQKKDEIKNPYDLVVLFDCMDARIRGLEKGKAAFCPCVIKKNKESKSLGRESKSYE